MPASLWPSAWAGDDLPRCCHRDSLDSRYSIQPTGRYIARPRRLNRAASNGRECGRDRRSFRRTENSAYRLRLIVGSVPGRCPTEPKHPRTRQAIAQERFSGSRGLSSSWYGSIRSRLSLLIRMSLAGRDVAAMAFLVPGMVPRWFQLTPIEAAYDDQRGTVSAWKNASMPRLSRPAQSAAGIRNQQVAGSSPAPGSSYCKDF